MGKIIVFAGSNSLNSINKQLAVYAAGLLETSEFEVLDLNDFPVPIFGVDEETENGFPENALKFDELVKNCSGIIISLAEHNGSYSTVFKNLLDWLSRITKDTWQNKPMLLMSTSPGGRGGAGVLAAASDRFPRHKSNIIATFSLASFEKNFNGISISDSELHKELKNKVKQLESSL